MTVFSRVPTEHFYTASFGAIGWENCNARILQALALDPADSVANSLRDIAEALKEVGEAAAACVAAVTELAGIFYELKASQEEARRRQGSGWRLPPAPRPPGPPCRTIAPRRRAAPPRNRARSLPGGKWRARRAM